MAKSPKEQEIAIVNNLKAKTGKDIGEWIAILKQLKSEDKKEQLNWLKNKYGLGHFQAKIIIQRSIGLDNSAYNSSKDLIDNLFKGENEALKPLFKTISKSITKFGNDIQVKPCKTYLPFYRKRQFLILKPKKGFIYIGLPLASDYKHELLTSVKGLGLPEKITFALTIRTEEDITENIIDLIRICYDKN
jgi:predicted transport protein